MEKNFLLMKRNVAAKLAIFFVLSLFLVSAAKAQTNLLKNPGFETPTDGSTILPPEWSQLSEDDLLVDDPLGTDGQWQSPNRLPATDAFYTGNNATFNPNPLAPRAGSNYCIRLVSNNTVGIYQEVSVVPGTDYTFSAWVCNVRTNATSQSEVRTEYLRIKDVNDLTHTLQATKMDFTEANLGLWIQVTGKVTIPANVNKIRFQVSHYNLTNTTISDQNRMNQALLVDDCTFTGQVPTSVPNVAVNPVQVSSQNGALIVKSDAPIEKVDVINLSGQLLRSVAGNGNAVEIQGLLQKQALIVKVTVNGEVIVRKVIG